MEQNKITIPEELQQICREMAQIARKYKLNSFSGKFQPTNCWSGDISFSWQNGRHGEDSKEISISSQFFVHTKIDAKDKDNEE